MLEKITWGEYWLTLGVLTAIYEIGVFLYFRRLEISKKTNASLTIGSNMPFNSKPESDLGLAPTETDSFRKSQTYNQEKQTGASEVAEVLQQLRVFIRQMAKGSYVKEEVMMGITVILGDYENLRGTEEQKIIDNILFEECKNNCSIHLSADELKMLWQG